MNIKVPSKIAEDPDTAIDHFAKVGEIVGSH